MVQMTSDWANLPEHEEYGVLPKGNYEMVIKNVQERATQSGAESIQVDFVVRNDLDGVRQLMNTNGKYHNRHVFMDNWKRKATQQYDLEQLQLLMMAAGFPDHHTYDFPNDFISFLKSKPVKVYVNVRKNEYQGEVTDQNQVAPWNVTQTDFPNVQHKWKSDSTTTSNGNNPFDEAMNNLEQEQSKGNPLNGDPFVGSSDSIDISDDDLPF